MIAHTYSRARIIPECVCAVTVGGNSVTAFEYSAEQRRQLRPSCENIRTGLEGMTITPFAISVASVGAELPRSLSKE